MSVLSLSVIFSTNSSLNSSLECPLSCQSCFYVSALSSLSFSQAQGNGINQYIEFTSESGNVLESLLQTQPKKEGVILWLSSYHKRDFD